MCKYITKGVNQMTNRKEYKKAYYEAHKEQMKEQRKAYYQAHKEEAKAAMKDYYQAHKEEIISKKKAYEAAHKEQRRASNKASNKAWNEAHKEQRNNWQKAYSKSDVNSLGQTKHSIRYKSQRILKKSCIKIPGYEIHHCFGYEDASKFIYISKSLHLKIHQYLRDNNIDAGKDHWMAIRDIVNNTDEFTYIKC